MGISSALGSSALVPAGFGFRNLIINGDFEVAQRGTSFVSGANNDDTYNLDRWTILSDGNDVVDITQATDVPTGGLYSIGLDVETANKKFGIIQFIEQRNLTGIQNQTVWLSFKAKTTGSSISNVKAAVLSWTGTADTVTSDVVSAWGADGVTPTWATNWTAENTPANLGVTGSWAEYRASALMDTSSIKNVAVFIWCDDTSTTLGDFLYVTDVQLEINNSPTPFERRPFGVELALCQRYYEKSYADATAPGTATNESSITSSYTYGATTASWIGTSSAYKVTKMKDPDVTIYDIAGNSGKVTRETAGVAADDNQTVGVSAKSGVNNVYVDSSGTANRASINFHFVAVAEL